MNAEYSIVGGGIVGLSIAYGLLRLGKTVQVFDEGDSGVRASRGNFGLVWVQGKGAVQPAYARWTRRSAHAWRSFCDELEQQSGNRLHLQQDGGYRYFFSEAEMHQKAESYRQLANHLDDDYPFEVLGHNALRQEEPAIGPEVVGATLHHEDGHVNSLKLFRSLTSLIRQQAGAIHENCSIGNIVPEANGFALHSTTGAVSRSEKVVLCAGLGTMKLGPMLGFKSPIRPQRGQVLITERTAPIMARPSDVIRQVDEGGVQIGASAEEVGIDDRESLQVTSELAHQAARLFPTLGAVNIVRSWAALRIMSPDGLPIYQQSSQCPGAFFVTCHSGITLAAAHARYLPLWISGAADAPNLSAFSEERF